MEKATESSSKDFKVIGNWDEQSKKLQEKFPQLTGDDLKFESGQEKELLGRVEQRLNKGRDEVINILKKNQPQV